MANITAGMVKDLRERTGAGMMECKSALNETNGDMEAAIDFLRKKGLAKAAKKAGRTAAEGLIGVSIKDGKGAIIEVNSETDFVARNDEFQSFVTKAAKHALEVEGDLEKLLQHAFDGKATTAEYLTNLVAKIGENMNVRRAAAISVSPGVVGAYIHNAVMPDLGKIGVLVALQSSGKAEELAPLAKQIAMHIASANPIALDASGVDPAIVKREKDILADKFRQQGKPEAMIEKITESGIKTFYKENTLLDQMFIFDDKKSVSQAVKEAEGKAGAPIKIANFIRFALGEGIVKEETDFAAEVRATAGQG